MNPTHIHLLITHLPIYGSILGALALGFGMMTQSSTTQNAAYLILLIAAIGGVAAFLTGEPAEETVENISGISKNLVEEHEESANLTLILTSIMGLLSCVGLFLSWKKAKFIRVLPVLVLMIAIASFGAAARTGYLGGKIRHTEINNPIKNIYEDKR